MKIWIIKAIVQKMISFLPFKHQVNYLFQKYITRGVQLTDAYFEDKLIHAFHHFQYYKKHVGKTNFKVLELGSGWYPVIPVYLYLHGASEIISIDIAQHITKKNLEKTIKKFLEYLPKNEFHDTFLHIDENRKEELQHVLDAIQDFSIEEIMLKLKMDFQIQDARKTHFESNYFDLITSNNTFEHIYDEILVGILEEFKRILHPKGIMSHFIDMSDHFAHLDNKITIYNFLQFTEKKWNRIDNTIQPQNRLRINQYKGLLKEISLTIMEEINRPGDMEVVKSMKLADPFSDYSLQDVAVSHTHMVLQK